MPWSQTSRCESSGLKSVHASSPMLAAAWESTSVNSGSDLAAAATLRGAAPPNPHPQRMIAYPPVLRLTSNPLLVRRMKRWTCRKTAQQNHRGAAQNSCCGRSERSVGTGPAESSHCNPEIAQSSSRWFSARGAITALPCLHTQNECINYPRMQLRRAG